MADFEGMGYSRDLLEQTTATLKGIEKDQKMVTKKICQFQFDKTELEEKSLKLSISMAQHNPGMHDML